METLRNAIDEHPELDADELAALVVDGLPRDELVYLVAQEIIAIRRHQTRAIEAEAFRSMRPGFSPGRKPKSGAVEREGFKALFGASFRVGDGSKVMWEHATVEQHKQRKAMLSKMRDGLNETISFHDQAISALEAAGVSCLAELDEGQAAA